jgi:hypothetical protein
MYFPPTIKDRVLTYVTEHQREILQYKKIAAEMGVNATSVKESAYALIEEGKIKVLEARKGPGGGIVLEVVAVRCIAADSEIVNR